MNGNTESYLIYIGSSQDDLEPIPTPTTFEQTFQDLDSPSTTRTLTGRMVRYTARSGHNAIRSIALGWNNICAEDAQKILRLTAEEFFWVKYPDVFDGLRTAEFYAGDRKCTIKRINLDIRGSDITVGSLELTLIER